MEIRDRLAQAEWPTGVRACAYRTLTDEVMGDVADVVLILDYDTWTDETAEVCEAASDVAAATLATSDYFVMTTCRTPAEHQAFAAEEGDIWSQLETSAC